MGNLSHMFLTAPDLDQDLGNVGILLETSNQDECVSQDPVEFPSYFVNLRPQARSKYNIFFKFIYYARTMYLFRREW